MTFIALTINLFLLTYNVNSQTIIYGNGTSGPYKFSDKVIFVGTDSVLINDSLVNQSAYLIDYNQGTITFYQALPESVKVIVRYKVLPFQAGNTKYFNYALKTQSDTESISKFSDTLMTLIKPIQDIQSEDIVFSGSKTISVDVGNKQGVGLEQATRIDLNGNLQGVNISAILSDVGNPIPPEGTTKELSEFDKILINLKTDKFSGSYGDNELIYTIGNLGKIQKKITGVLFNGEINKNTTSTGYAKSKGIYKKLIFNGQDGKQGPYYLTKEMSNASVVPGSENVYLMGKRMFRGQTEDYTIDYSQGSITFTNRQIINSFSRIEIDFEYTNEEYNRYLYFGNIKLPISKFQFSSSFFKEFDDMSQNLMYSLSDEERLYLANLDTDSNYVWLSGIKFVGTGNGDYIKQDSYFVYVGLDSGDYELKFSFVGAGLGSYDFDNFRGGFRYLGQGNGKYVPKVRIQLPEQNQIYNANLKFEGSSGFNVDVQGFLSQREPNRFSVITNNKSGLYYIFNTGYVKEKFRVNYRRLASDNRFYFSGSPSAIDFSYHWLGVKQESIKTLDELDFRIKPVRFLILDGGYGWLKSFDQSYRQRLNLAGKVLIFNDNTLMDYNIKYYPNLLSRYSVNISPSHKILYPSLGLFWEKEKEASQRYIMPSIQLKSGDNLNINFSSDLKLKSQSVTKATQNNQVHKIELFFAKNNLNINTTLGYQKNKIDNLSENANFFGDVSSQISVISGLNIAIDYLHQQGETQTMEINYVWAGEGLGNYKQNPETREYYFDPKGDYIQQLIPSGNFIASQTRNFQGNWNFYGWQFINFEGYYTTNNQIATEGILQTFSSRQFNLSLLPYEKLISLRLINSADFSKDNQYSSLATQQNNNSNRIELTSQKIDELPFKLSFEINNQKNERIGQGILEKRNERIYTLNPSIGYNVDFQVEISYCIAKISKPRYYAQSGEFGINTWKFLVSKNWQMRKETNLNITGVITQRTATITQLPYDINLYEPKGITPELKINIDHILKSAFTSEKNQAFNQLILGIGYIFSKHPQKPVEHNFSMKLQAVF